MAAGKKGLLQAAYPVWVGSLDAAVDEELLTSAFQHFGKVHSAVVQRDEFGRSKCFGYVNFTSQSKAEKAAGAMNSKSVAGKKIKTKGPRMLQTEGHFVCGGKDYRPLTDCRYFMKRGHCKRKKKKLCPYRHNDIARYTTIVCKKWQGRECLNVDCIMLHPGGLGVKRSSGSNNDEEADDGVEIIPYSSNISGDSSSQSEDESVSSAMFTANTIGNNRLSDEQVAKMMDLDFDDDTPAVATAGKSRLRRKASSSSSSSSSSSISDNSDDEIAPIRSHRSSKSKLNKSNSKVRLNEGSLSSDGEEAIVKVKHSKTRKTSGGSRTTGNTAQAPLEPVGIFWDIENCKVPNGRSAFYLAQKFRQHFVEGKREVEFMCVCDTLKETGEVINDLNKAHVTVVHVSAIAKNAADDKLRVSLRRFADTYDSPATIVMVTSDVNFSNDLHDLRHRHMFTVVLVHNLQVSYALKACAHMTIVFEDFIIDIPNREQDAAMRTIYAVTVKGFSPSLSRFKVKDRLLYLTENCGGSVNDVCDIKSGTARVRFRTYEAALRAQARLHGANMFGYPLSAILEQPQQPQPRPQPMSWQVNNHPLLSQSASQQHHMLRPHPFQQLPCPNMPSNYNLSASFPPSSGIPFNNPPPLSVGSKTGQPIIPAGVPAEFYFPKPPHTTKPLMNAPPIPHGVHMSPPPLLSSPIHRDQEIIIVAGKGRIVIDTIKAVLDKTLVAIPTNKLTGEIVKFCLMASVMIDQDMIIYWHGCMQYIVVVTVDLMKTSQVIQTGPSPSDVLHNQVMGRALLKKCCDILVQKFQSQQLLWNVYPCTWPQQQEEMIKIRSQVIKILKEHDFGWANWTTLSIQYNNIMKAPSIIPAQLEMCCQGAVELQGANMATMVAILTEMSPNICVSSEPSVPRRLVRIIKKYSDGVPLLNLVGMYWKEFGPLPMEKNGKKVLDLIMSQKGITYNGNIQDWITVKVYMVDMSKTLGVDTRVIKPSLNELYEEFRALLINTPSQRILLEQFQPFYQTYYKKSFRVSDYGKDKLVDLLMDCPHLKLISNMVYLRMALMDANNSPLHVISPPAPNVSTSPSTKASSSFSSPLDDSTDITELYKSIKQILVSTGDGKITLNNLKTRLMAEQKLSNANYFLQLLSECDFLKIEETQDGKIVCWSDKWLAERKKMFAKECKEVLGKEKAGEISLKRFPEEFYRINKRQLVCAEYGYKKLLNMLENVSGVEVITTGNQSTIKLIESTASNMPSLSLIKLQLEEYLWRCPDHTSTQVKLKPGFEASTKYKLDYSAYGFSKLTFMLEAMSDTIKLTGDGPNRLVSLQPLRKFACEVRQVMQDYPSGLCFSNFAPAFRSCLGYECIVGHYGNFTKLSQLFEGIPDTAKIIGESMSKKVYLTHSKITSNVQVDTVTMPTKAGNVAWNILRMLVANKDHMIPLGDLAGHYSNAFSHQIKLSNYGYSNMETFLSSLPSIVVKEQDSKKMVTSDLPLLFVRDTIVLMVQCQQHTMKWTDFLINYGLNSGEPFDVDAYDGPSDVIQLLLSCSPWIMVDNTSSGMILRLPPFARTDEFIEAVNNSNIKLKSSGDDGELAADAISTGKDYRRLLSETKRLLLMSPTYSLTLAQILEHFIVNGDPICTSTTELHHVLTSTQNSFMFNAAECVVAVDMEARKKKLSKDFLYLFNKLNAWQLNMTEMTDYYEECFYSPLEPHLYGCNNMVELMKCKYINQILEIGPDGACVLSYAGKLNVLAARFAELLFIHAAGWVYIDCFDTYQKHFGTSLELGELRVDSIEELINKPNLRPVVMSDGGILKLRAQAMLAESLRHLLSIYNGKLQLDQLPQLFHQAFNHLPVIMEDAKIQEWISGNGNILSNASQVVHLNNNQWLVWAPGAYQYPTRTINMRHMYSRPPAIMTVPDVTTTTAGATNDNAHILHGHDHISGSSNADGTGLTAAVSPSNGKKVAGGAKKKNMAIKFPSASMIKAKEDIPPLIESSNDEL